MREWWRIKLLKWKAKFHYRMLNDKWLPWNFWQEGAIFGRKGKDNK